MERLHTGDRLRVFMIALAVDQDRGNPNITRAFDIGCRFVADVTGLLRQYIRPVEIPVIKSCASQQIFKRTDAGNASPVG